MLRIRTVHGDHVGLREERYRWDHQAVYRDTEMDQYLRLRWPGWPSCETIRPGFAVYSRRCLEHPSMSFADTARLAGAVSQRSTGAGLKAWHRRLRLSMCCTRSHERSSTRWPRRQTSIPDSVADRI